MADILSSYSPYLAAMSGNGISDEQKQFLDWQAQQVNPFTGKTFDEMWKAQGIDPYSNAATLANSAEAMQRAKDSANLLETYGRGVFDQGGTNFQPIDNNGPVSSINAEPTADYLTPWTNPQWQEKQSSAQAEQQARWDQQAARDAANGVVIGGAAPGGNTGSPGAPGAGSGASPYSASNFLQWNSPVVVGPVDNSGSSTGPAVQKVTSDSQGMLGAGNANYNSSLIKSLRRSSITPFSSNPGVDFYANRGTESSNWTPPVGMGSAFNPQVFNQRQATPQEVIDWNAYNAYRASSVGASQPYLSMVDWIAAGRPGAGGFSGSSGSGGSSSTVPTDGGYQGGDGGNGAGGE